MLRTTKIEYSGGEMVVAPPSVRATRTFDEAKKDADCDLGYAVADFIASACVRAGFDTTQDKLVDLDLMELMEIYKKIQMFAYGKDASTGKTESP